jgi:hypothetical protein
MEAQTMTIDIRWRYMPIFTLTRVPYSFTLNRPHLLEIR